MNRLPELRSFLKDGEAEQYVGLTVVYIPGRQAVLTVYHSNSNNDDDDDDGGKPIKTVHTQVTLSDIPTKKEMHALMVDQGFTRKAPAVLKRIAQEKQILQETEDYHTWRRSMYFREQRDVVANFKRDVMGVTAQDKQQQQPQSRLGREPDFLVDQFDKRNAAEKEAATGKFNETQALQDYYSRQSLLTERLVQRRLAAMQSDRDEL